MNALPGEPVRTAAYPPVAYGARPVLGLLVGTTPPGLRDLLVALYPRCDPRHVAAVSTEPGSGPVAYVVAAFHEPVSTDRPFAWWLMSPADADNPLAASAAVVLTHDPTIADAVPIPVQVVPWSPQPTGVAVAPVVRARLRVARGLAGAPIASYEHSAWSWRADSANPAATLSNPRLVDTVCALAAAVVATSPAEAVRAMSWAAPTVLDPATAEAIGAADGVDCLVGSTGELRLVAARELASDSLQAARLSRAARELVTARHDLASLARRVGDCLNLPVPGDGPQGLLDAALADLGTPPTSIVRTRAAGALAGFQHRPRPAQSA